MSNKVKNFDGAHIAAGVEVPYRRHANVKTTDLLASAFNKALEKANIPATDVDGLGVASFTMGPDRAIDLAWRLGLSPRWSMDDGHGGASGINLLQHAIRAVQSGDASVIVLVSGDHFEPADFTKLVENYNITTRDHLRPLNIGGPNSLFAMLTSRHMRTYGLDRADYGAIAMAQRQWAMLNPDAIYRTPLTLNDYLDAPMVSDPLCRYDCVPVVSGANAIVITSAERTPANAKAIRIKSLRALHNHDHQEGDGLTTGLASIANELWTSAGLGPDDVDLISVYDDYPVMVLAQLADLGFIKNQDFKGFIHNQIATRKMPINTSGGQLSAGQAGAACSMHGLVEAITQLRGEAQDRQIKHARTAVVTGYGMVEYRYGMCANAVVLETAQ